jgi:hypothetical protein
MLSAGPKNGRQGRLARPGRRSADRNGEGAIGEMPLAEYVHFRTSGYAFQTVVSAAKFNLDRGDLGLVITDPSANSGGNTEDRTWQFD